MSIKILGNGVWGQAVYSVIKQNSPEVSFIGREEYSDDQDILILAVPVQAIRNALQFISFKDRKKIIINTAKGIEKESHMLPQEIVREVLGIGVEYFALIGPSFAQEVVDKMPTVVNLGYNDKTENLNYLHKLFQTDYFTAVPVKGVEVLELAAAFKNMYAIICGLSEGLGYGTNTRVALLVRAMEEFRQLCHSLNLHIDPIATIGTTGDLILTCNSIESRNYTFGKYLADMTAHDALHKVGTTTEGYHSLASIESFENRAGMQLNVLHFLNAMVKQNDPSKIRQMFLEFLKRN